MNDFWQRLDEDPRYHRFQVVTLVTAPLVGIVLAIFLLWQRAVFPQDLMLLAVFYALTAFGITVGYHRMLTHHGFDASPVVRGIFLILGAMAIEGPANKWASTHIKHHAYSDEEGDPHTPLDGFWHAHMGWLFSIRNFASVEKYAPSLLQDRVCMFVSRTTGVWVALGFVIPFLIGGWTGLVWGGLVRAFLVTHVTWSVNSICHVFGKRPFTTTDMSRNHWLVGLLAFGEGWHNNHHAFPSNAFHGLKWWQLDLSGRLIGLLERLHLVWDVQRVPPGVVEARKRASENMLRTMTELRAQLMANVQAARKSLEEFYVTTARFLPVAKKEGRALSLSTFTTIHHEALRRLEEIQANARRVQYMKRQRVLQYQQEIQMLVGETREKLRQELGVLLYPAQVPLAVTQ